LNRHHQPTLPPHHQTPGCRSTLVGLAIAIDTSLWSLPAEKPLAFVLCMFY